MPRRSYDTGGVTMWPSARTIAILLTLGLASGGAALGVNALLASSGDPGTDYGLDTETNACGYGYRLAPPPLMDAGSSPMPFAWTYERYFFPAGAQTIRMAFDGEDIVRAGTPPRVWSGRTRRRLPRRRFSTSRFGTRSSPAAIPTSPSTWTPMAP